MKYLIAVIVFLAFVCVYLNFRVDILKKENIRLESEKNALISNIKEYKKNEVAANNEIKKLRNKISVDKKALNWYNSKLPDTIINELHKR
jgi:cell division protein FtsB